ncbi:MAG TPA: hypothetical protein PKC13_32045, partial [Blastocatellia bacterium]|nr:hypothetical protein [Blastocatellia bacterium]
VFPVVRPVAEEGGCHVVPLGGDAILIAASAPRTADALADLGFEPRVVDISACRTSRYSPAASVTEM